MAQRRGRCLPFAGCCAVTRIIQVATTPFPRISHLRRCSRGQARVHANKQAVMDTQRLVLFVIFSFSALLLWEAWQKETRPPPPPAVAAQQGKSAPAAEVPAVPVTPTPQATGTSSATPPASVPAAPPAANGAAGTTGRLITITTDLYRAQVDTIGGTITEVQLLKHRDPFDETKPYPL